MEINGISSYANILNAIEYSGNPATISEAIIENAEIEDRVELSVAAIKMAQEAEASAILQLVESAIEGSKQPEATK